MKNTVFITGGSSGIGAAAVKKFLEEGWNVLFTDIHEPKDVENGARFVKADSSKKSEMEYAAQVAVKEFGGINALFCNSGIHRRNTVLDISQEELDLVIQTNIYMALCIRFRQCCLTWSVKRRGQCCSTLPTSFLWVKPIVLYMA